MLQLAEGKSFGVYALSIPKWRVITGGITESAKIRLLTSLLKTLNGRKLHSLSKNNSGKKRTNRRVFITRFTFSVTFTLFWCFSENTILTNDSLCWLFHQLLFLKSSRLKSQLKCIQLDLICSLQNGHIMPSLGDERNFLSLVCKDILFLVAYNSIIRRVSSWTTTRRTFSAVLTWKRGLTNRESREYLTEPWYWLGKQLTQF